MEQIRPNEKRVKGPEADPGFWLNLLLALINAVPLAARVRFFRWLGDLAYVLDERHRRIALRNLAVAFPERDEKERRRIGRAAFRHAATVLAEFFFIPKLDARRIGKYVRFEGLEHIRKAEEKGRGILFLTAHFGNWEWMAISFPLLTGNRLGVVYRPIDSAFLDRLVGRLRGWTGNIGIPKQKAMMRILRSLKEGTAVGILLDQNMAWQEGVFVRFFGEWACTNEGLALLALKTGAAVLPAFSVREQDGTYRVVVEPEVELIRSEDKERDVRANTQLFTGVIERYVRRYPEQWLWLHQRWKTRPWQSKRKNGTGGEAFAGNP